MMFPESMPERVGTNRKGKEDHKAFKCCIINNIGSENGQGGHN